MTYLDTYELTTDRNFQGRIVAAASEQALIFINDARPEYVAPSSLVILSQHNALPLVSLVAAQPAITGDASDGDLLAALQAVWPHYGAALLSDEQPAAPLVEDVKG